MEEIRREIGTEPAAGALKSRKNKSAYVRELHNTFLEF